MTSPLWGNYCDGGHFCSVPKECCHLGCCYHTQQSNRMFNYIFFGHWYFWAIVAVLVTLLCLCSFWRRCQVLFHILCCFFSNREERVSERDSTGSFYAPPQYSRCNSFHHAPPPYTEVTSKPDLYPVVISYNGDSGTKSGGSAGYLMVQYFRNYILRPSGSISATSTVDSLSSSFICNAVNEANSIIPPTYSCTVSLDGFSITANPTTDVQMLHSVSSVLYNDYQTNSSSGTSQHNTANPSTPHSSLSGLSLNTHYSKHSPNYGQSSNRVSPGGVSMKSNTNHNKSLASSTSEANDFSIIGTNESPINSETTFKFCAEKKRDLEQNLETCCNLMYSEKNPNLVIKKNVLSTDNSVDSENQGDDNNFSELLNLSMCVPSRIINCSIGELCNYDCANHPNLTDLQQSYSLANSVTVSDISSLANLGTPDSPPRATSPTVEIKELLDKIRQLPQQKSPPCERTESTQSTNTNFFVKNKSKTLYMPLNSANKVSSTSTKHSASIFAGSSSIFSYAEKATKAWLSRSAPSTPCSNFTPLFSSQLKKGRKGSQKDSKSKLDDGGALLDNDNIDSENNDECL